MHTTPAKWNKIGTKTITKTLSEKRDNSRNKKSTQYLGLYRRFLDHRSPCSIPSSKLVGCITFVVYRSNNATPVAIQIIIIHATPVATKIVVSIDATPVAKQVVVINATPVAKQIHATPVAIQLVISNATPVATQIVVKNATPVATQIVVIIATPVAKHIVIKMLHQ